MNKKNKLRILALFILLSMLANFKLAFMIGEGDFTLFEKVASTIVCITSLTASFAGMDIVGKQLNLIRIEEERCGKCMHFNKSLLECALDGEPRHIDEWCKFWEAQ